MQTNQKNTPQLSGITRVTRIVSYNNNDSHNKIALYSYTHSYTQIQSDDTELTAQLGILRKVTEGKRLQQEAISHLTIQQKDA